MQIPGVRTDRLGLLLDRFDRARETAQVRLTGLGDEEYSWEPAPAEWVLDQGAPDIPANQYDEAARQAAAGMSVAKIAEGWSVSVERVEEVLAHSGPRSPTRCRSPRSRGGRGTCTSASRAKGSGPSVSGSGSRGCSSASPLPPRRPWSGSGR